MFKKIISVFGYLVLAFCLPHRVFTHRFCKFTYIHGMYTANCAYRGQVNIPQDLNPATEILILSHNNLAHVYENSFSNYTNLVELYLDNNRLVSFDRNALSSLTKLKILIISNLRPRQNHAPPLDINWPSSIEKLTMDRNHHQVKIDLSNISKLQVFSAVDCSLMYFPIFNESARLREIYLSKNPLNYFAVRNLSSLCQLRTLHLWWTRESTMNSSERWCDCLQIETWVKHRRIEATELNCTTPKNVNISSCDLSFQEEARILEECLSKSIKMGWVLGYVVVAIVCGSIILFLWYRRRRM